MFGQSPAGLNATGDSDMRNYYDKINSQQNAKLTESLVTIYDLVCRSEFGEAVPKGFGFDYNPLWQLSDPEKVSVASGIGAAVSNALADGTIDQLTALRELRQQSRITNIFSNITDEMIKAAQDDPPPMPHELEQQTQEAGIQAGAQAKMQTAAHAQSIAPAPLMPGEEPGGEYEPEPDGPAPIGEETTGIAPAAGLIPQPEPLSEAEMPGEAMSEHGNHPEEGNGQAFNTTEIDDGDSRIKLVFHDGNAYPARTLHGIDVVIETPRGTVRRGYGWATEMPADYGYIQGTSSAEGPQEQLDVFVGDVPESEIVWVIEQQDPDLKEFDEHKVMLNFGSEEEALDAYHAAFSDGRGPDRVRNVRRMHVDVLKNWIATQPYGRTPT